MTIKTIKETKNYLLGVGVASGATSDKDLTYKVINKTHGVVEVETTLLPQGYKFLHDLEEHLLIMEDVTKESTLTPVAPFHTGRSKIN